MRNERKVCVQTVGRGGGGTIQILGGQLQQLREKGRKSQARRMHLSERLAALDGPTNSHRRGTHPCFLCQPPQRVRGNVVEKKHPNACVGQAGAG